jgi:peptidoglycan/xylan/chitin deacetylase (PgdA/CDA1 family)
MRRPHAVLAVAVTGLLLSGCGSQGDGEKLNAGASAAPAASDAPAASPEASAAAAVDPAAVSANELGKVPVMMYHVVKVDAKGEYDQTPDDFRKELERLYKDDYRPVTASDFSTGKIDIPAGKHAIVMTFDDSTVSQAQIGADGQPTPDTALGIMEAFGKEHPDFKITATFYVNSGSFSDAKVIPWLVEHGYEVGAHTLTHANLKQISSDKVLKEIGGNVNEIEAAVPGYKVKTFARPFGIAPLDKMQLHSGTYEGKAYNFTGVMLVGSNPSPSPYSSTFDAFAIPRIRSGLKSKPVLMDSGYWLDSLEKSPKSLYVSDGDPNKISFPADSSVKIAEAFKDKANPYSASGSTAGSSGAASTAEPTTAATPGSMDMGHDMGGETSMPTPGS